MLNHSKIDMEVSNVDIKTMESDDCTEMLRDDRNVNSHNTRGDKIFLQKWMKVY